MAKRVITIIAFIAVFFISVQYAEAEVIVIEGMDNYNGIFISLEENSNLIMFDTNDKNTIAFDSRINTYHNGGFSMKNVEEHIAVWVHPINDTDYRLVILTSDGVYRMIASIINDDIDVQPTTQSSELVSSIGADISRWDIPTQGRAEHTPYVKQDKVHDPDSLDLLLSIPKTVQYKHTLNFDITAIDNQIKSEKDQRLGNVLIKTSMISPLEEIVETWEGYTNDFGVFSGSFFVPDNQRIGEYTLDIVGNMENYTSKSYAISFFIITLDDGGSRCGGGFFFNSTSASCQVE